MGTIADAITNLPVIYQKRYSTQFVVWYNELLEELSGEGLLPSVEIEAGFVVADKDWITKPAGLREIRKIWNPQTVDQRYNWRFVNNKIKLVGAEVDAESSPAAITAFSNYATTYVDVNIDDKAANDFADYLLVISTGTYAGRTYEISRSDASAGGVTRIYFLHALTAAMSGTTVLTGYLAHPDYYVMMQYSSSFDAASTTADTIAIDSQYQKRIVSAYFEWRAAKRVAPTSPVTREAYSEYKRVLGKIKEELRVIGGPAVPRYAPGFSQYQNKDGDLDVSYERDN
jgi:hypothetical protein